MLFVPWCISFSQVNWKLSLAQSKEPSHLTAVHVLLLKIFPHTKNTSGSFPIEENSICRRATEITASSQAQMHI